MWRLRSVDPYKRKHSFELSLRQNWHDECMPMCQVGIASSWIAQLYQVCWNFQVQFGKSKLFSVSQLMDSMSTLFYANGYEHRCRCKYSA